MRPGGSAWAPRWALAVFGLAFAAPRAFSLLSDQPLLYRHQHYYFHNGLSIALRPDALSYVLRSEEWRTWMSWTIAPLYYVFEAAVLLVFGPQLNPLRLLQWLMGSATAVAVASLGRAAAGPRGVWAGVAFAFYAFTVELPSDGHRCQPALHPGTRNSSRGNRSRLSPSACMRGRCRTPLNSRSTVDTSSATREPR